MKKNRKILKGLASFLMVLMVMTFALPFGAFAATDETLAEGSTSAGDEAPDTTTPPAEEEPPAPIDEAPAEEPPAEADVDSGEPAAPAATDATPPVDEIVQASTEPAATEETDTLPVKYTVTFYTEDNAVYETVEVEENAALEEPSVEPTAPEGTRFDGWFEADAEEPYAFENSAITGNLKLYAAFEALADTDEEDAKEEELPDEIEDAILPTGDLAPDTGNSFQSDIRSSKTLSTDHTVTFMVEDVEYAVKNVQDQTLVVMPAAPSSEDGLPFVGWYTGEGAPFNQYGVITEDLTLTAKFSDEAVLVTYLDTDGAVLEVLEGLIGQPAPDTTATPSLNMGEELLHWALKGTTEAFEEDLSESITLVPVLSEISIAVFVTNGSEIDPQTGKDGFNAIQPAAPTRDGFTFVGWTAEENATVDADGNYDAFDFENTPISGTVFIYAVWQNADTEYTVNIWVEAPNAGALGNPATGSRTGYELRYTAINQPGTTGDEVALTEDDARELVKASSDTAVKNLLTYSTFEYSENVELSPNGDSIVNVFFTRTSFKFVFDVSTGVTAKGGQIFVHGVSKGSRYELDLKVEQDVSTIWPTEVLFTDGNYFLNWSNYYGNNALQVSYSYISVAFSGPNPVGVGAYHYDITPPVAGRTQANLKPTFSKDVFTETREYYLELTEAEKDEHLNGSGLPGAIVRTWTPRTPNAAYPGERYYKRVVVSSPNNQRADPGKRNTDYGPNGLTAYGWPGRDIDGFETIGSTTGACLARDFMEVLSENGKVYTLNYFMPRKSTTLTLKTGNGTIENPAESLSKTSGTYTATLKYDEPLDNVVPTDVQLKDHKFTGWFLDENFTKKYTPGGNMPGTNLTLYAQYEGTLVNVIYDDGGLTPVVTRTYARGEKLNAHNLAGTAYEGKKVGDYIPGKGTFKGWYYDVGEGSTKASVAFPTGLKLNRDEYVLKAQLTPETYTVTFVGDEDGTGKYTTTYDEQDVRSGGRNTLALSGHTDLVPPAREGYIFKGWSTTQSGNIANFSTAKQILENTTVYAIWEIIKVDLIFDANGGELTPADLRYTVDYGQSIQDKNLDVPGSDAVERAGYTLLGWYTQDKGGKVFNPATQLKETTTVYAHWDDGKKPVTPPGTVTTQDPDPDPKPDPKPETRTDTSTDSQPPIVEVDTTPTATIPTETTIPTPENTIIGDEVSPLVQAQLDSQSGNIFNDILNDKVPTGGPAFRGAWSLLSLMMAIGGFVISLFVLISMLGRKKERDEEEIELDDIEAQAIAADADAEEEEPANKKRSRLMKALIILLGLFTGILFLILDDLSLPMVFINKWTLWIAIPFVAHLLALAVHLLAKRRKKDEEEDENGCDPTMMQQG